MITPDASYDDSHAEEALAIADEEYSPPPRESASDFIAKQSAMMESVVNEEAVRSEVTFKTGVISISTLAAFDAEEVEENPDNPQSFEFSASSDPRARQILEIGTEAAIRKFCELEGLKQEFKNGKSRLIGKWK